MTQGPVDTHKPARVPLARRRAFVLLAVIVILVVAIDQLTKYLVRSNMALGSSVTVIPGLFDFHYIVNGGAAFGMFQNATTYFLIIAAIMVAAVIVYLALAKNVGRFETVTLALIAAGAIGNAIDRAFMGGLVTDFIATTFMDFPIFNVADISITIGCILFIIAFLFVGRKDSDISKDGEPVEDKTTEA